MHIFFSRVQKILFLCVASVNAFKLIQAQTLQVPKWELGTAVGYGFAPNYELRSPAAHQGADLNFSNLQLHAGRLVCAKCFNRRFQAQALVEVFPFWLAKYPRQTHTIVLNFPPYSSFQGTAGPYSSYGSSLTPLLVRFTFGRTNVDRIMPWAQLGGGLLWTNHKFPLRGGSTSVINFTPQAGVGLNISTKPRQHVELGIKAIHISNAGLADSNPGVNLTLQFTTGYSWSR